MLASTVHLRSIDPTTKYAALDHFRCRSCHVNTTSSLEKHTHTSRYPPTFNFHIAIIVSHPPSISHRLSPTPIPYLDITDLVLELNLHTMADTNDLLAEKLFSVKDHVCVVTGGGSGIGLMAAQALSANGP